MFTIDVSVFKISFCQSSLNLLFIYNCGKTTLHMNEKGAIMEQITQFVKIFI
ncbi:hypothetical protein BLGI_169 [Brevibacillus laterosporus GI-9]|nr:hypothetical protein BLGI_169 [Brevibacillus laterosporus GI-9]